MTALNDAVARADLLVHLGAGKCRELSDYVVVRGGKRTVLVEANPGLANSLAMNVGEVAQFSVVQCAVAGETSQRELRVYNLIDHSSLREATDLKSLYPGIRLRERIPLHARSIEDLLAELDPDRTASICLVIDTPGEELSILQSLVESDYLEQCTDLILHCSHRALYESSADEDALSAYAEVHGYESIARDVREDPEFPTLMLQRDPWKVRCFELQAELEGVNKRLNDQNADLRSERERLIEAAREREAEVLALQDRHEMEMAAVRAQSEQARKEHTQSLATMDELVNELKARREQLAVELERLEAAAREKDSALELARAELEQVRQENEKALDAVEKRAAELEDQHRQAVSERERCKAENAEHVAAVQEELVEALRGQESLRAELETVRAEREREVKHAAQSLATAESRISMLEDERAELQQALQRESEAHGASETRLSFLESERDELRDEVERLKQDMDRHAVAMGEKDDELKGLRRDLGVALRMQALRDADIKDLQARYSTMHNVKERQQELLLKLQQRLSIAAERLQELAKDVPGGDDHTAQELIRALASGELK